MNQSLYTKASKTIGWDQKKIPVPTVEKANNLYKRVVDKKEYEAFVEVFGIYRFAPSANGHEQTEAAYTIHMAFKTTQGYFRKQFEQ